MYVLNSHILKEFISITFWKPHNGNYVVSQSVGRKRGNFRKVNDNPEMQILIPLHIKDKLYLSSESKKDIGGGVLIGCPIGN